MKERRKQDERKTKERLRFREGKGGDVGGHDVSLVTTATGKGRARL